MWFTHRNHVQNQSLVYGVTSQCFNFQAPSPLLINTGHTWPCFSNLWSHGHALSSVSSLHARSRLVLRHPPQIPHHPLVPELGPLWLPRVGSSHVTMTSWHRTTHWTTHPCNKDNHYHCRSHRYSPCTNSSLRCSKQKVILSFALHHWPPLKVRQGERRYFQGWLKITRWEKHWCYTRHMEYLTCNILFVKSSIGIIF